MPTEIFIIDDEADRVKPEVPIFVDSLPRIGETISLTQGEFRAVKSVVHHLYNDFQIDVHIARE